MDLTNIVLELMNRIQVLEGDVEKLKKQINNSEKQETFSYGEISNKYKPLAEYLYKSEKRRIVLTYAEIEAILGFTLPDTAYNYPQQYWANTETHSYSSAWLKIGYRTRTKDIVKQQVIFEKNCF